MKNKILLPLYTTLVLMFVVSCNRFLDEKSNSKLATPETLGDNQALLDMVQNVISNTASSGEMSTTDFYLTDNDFNALYYSEEKRLYTFQPDHVATSAGSGNDWLYGYRAIYIANAVLDNVAKYDIKNADNIKGQAYAIRAFRYLDLVQVYCPVYNATSASTDLGLPLRTDPDMNIPSVRSSVQKTYELIINDLTMAIHLLPDKQIAVTRPSKHTALGLLSRVYLQMGDYSQALKFAEEALKINSSLLDYNTLNSADAYPLKDLNVEVSFKATMYLVSSLVGTRARVFKNLYNLYDSNDLRKKMFFTINPNGEVLFKGNYTGGSSKFSGLANDEIVLIASECYARTGNIDKAKSTLDTLLMKRFQRGTFTNSNGNTKDEVLSLIIRERQKELLFRGLRWGDVKRLNRDGGNISAERSVNATLYSLAPNDLRYAIAIPEDVLKFSGIPQNKR